MFGAVFFTFMACATAAGSLVATEMESDTTNLEMVKENGLDRSENRLETLAKKVDEMHAVFTTRFIATRSSDGYLPTGTIQYDRELLGLMGNNFDPFVGKLSIPRRGIYKFDFSATCNKANCLIYFCVNGSTVKDTWSYSAYTGTKYWETTAIVALELNKGDQIWLHNDYSNSIYSGSESLLTFTGTFVKAT